MPLSSVLGASTLIKPGVVTSSTRPAVPYEGQLIFETDTDRIAAYNGSAWVTQNGLQLVATQTIGSAVSTVTVSNCFSSLYDVYKITISGGTSSAESQINMTLGSSTASYYSSGLYTDFTSGSTGTSTVNNGSAWQRVGYGTTSGTLVMNMDIYGPFLAANTYGTALYSRNGNFMGVVTHLHNVQTSYSSFTITPSTGTWTGGTIRVYGYASN